MFYGFHFHVMKLNTEKQILFVSIVNTQRVRVTRLLYVGDQLK